MAWTQASEPIGRQARVADGRMAWHQHDRQPGRTASARSHAVDVTLRGLVIVTSLAQIGLLVWLLAALPIAR